MNGKSRRICIGGSTLKMRRLRNIKGGSTCNWIGEREWAISWTESEVTCKDIYEEMETKGEDECKWKGEEGIDKCDGVG